MECLAKDDETTLNGRAHYAVALIFRPGASTLETDDETGGVADIFEQFG